MNFAKMMEEKEIMEKINAEPQAAALAGKPGNLGDAKPDVSARGAVTRASAARRASVLARAPLGLLLLWQMRDLARARR